MRLPRLTTTVAAGICLLSFPSNSFCLEELQYVRNLERKVGQMLLQRRFDELDKMADEYRTEKTRLPDGMWALTFFYQGFDNPPQGSSDADWNRVIELLKQWRTAKPDSVTARVALGHAYERYAYVARGTGPASQVTKEGWRLFGERLDKAMAVLEEAEKMSPHDPHCYKVMLGVARGQSWKRRKYETLFSQAVKLYPTYYQLYFEKATYLLPRWFGRPGDVEKFAEEAANATHDEEGDGLYTRIVMAVSWAGWEGEFFDQYRFAWPRIKQGFLDIQKKYPNSLWNLNSFCWFACNAHDKDTARELFQRIGDKWEPAIWKDDATFRRWKKWVGAAD